MAALGPKNKKRYLILENEAEKSLKTKGKATHVSRNEPENEPGKSFRFAPVKKTNPKTNLRSPLESDREKNEPENVPVSVVCLGIARSRGATGSLGQHQSPSHSAVAMAGNFTDAIDEPINFLAGGIAGAAGANHASILEAEPVDYGGGIKVPVRNEDAQPGEAGRNLGGGNVLDDERQGRRAGMRRGGAENFDARDAR